MQKTNLNEHNFLQQLLDRNRMTPSRPIVCSVHACVRVYLCIFVSHFASKPALFFGQLYKLHFVPHEMCRNRAVSHLYARRKKM